MANGKLKSRTLHSKIKTKKGYSSRMCFETFILLGLVVQFIVLRHSPAERGSTLRDAALVSMLQGKILVSREGIRFKYHHELIERKTSAENLVGLTFLLLLLAGDVEQNPGPVSMLKFQFREMHELSEFASESRKTFYEETWNKIPLELKQTNKNAKLPYEEANPHQYRSTYAKQISFKTSRLRLIGWVMALEFFYYDTVTQLRNTDLLPSSIRITWVDGNTKIKVDVFMEEEVESLVFHIFLTTGVITVMGAKYAEWCRTDFPFLREKVDELIKEMQNSNEVAGNVEMDMETPPALQENNSEMEKSPSPSSSRSSQTRIGNKTAETVFESSPEDSTGLNAKEKVEDIRNNTEENVSQKKKTVTRMLLSLMQEWREILSRKLYRK